MVTTKVLLTLRKEGKFIDGRFHPTDWHASFGKNNTETTTAFIYRVLAYVEHIYTWCPDKQKQRTQR